MIGYNYLPGRADSGATGIGGTYNSVGLGAWCTRKKLDGPYRRAPIMVDRLQQFGSGWQDASHNDRSFMVPLRTNIALITAPMQKYLPAL